MPARPWIVVLIALLGAAPPAGARVFLVGIDGGAWNVIDPMLAEGALPNLAALIERGATADLETVEPISSPVVWTSIATGRRPEAHGVGDFFATRLRIRVPSSFERLAAAGLRVGLYDCLMTWPPAALPDGFVIPGWLRRDDTVFPEDVWQRAATTPYVNAYSKLATSEDYLAQARRDVREKAGRFLRLAEAFDLQVGAVTFYAVDMTSHRFWHGAYPEEFEEPVRVAVEGGERAIRDAVVGVDRSVGEIAASLGPDDVLLLASDHGFRAREDGPRNVWVPRLREALALAGLEPERDGFSIVSSFGNVTLRVHPGPIAARDDVLEKLRALLESFQTADERPLFGVVESIDIAERPVGLRRPLATRIRQWAVRKGVEWGFGVELDTTAHAVLFALPDDGVLSSVWPDGAASVAGKTMPTREAVSRQVFTGDHDATAIFLAAGGPIAAVPERQRLSVLDVSPLLFHLAGQPIPDDLEGRLPLEIFDAEWLAAHPPRSVPAARAAALPIVPETGRDIGDPELVERLRALGYLD